MSNTITFINSPQASGITPEAGYNGITFSINGQNLSDVTGMSFMSMFQDEYPANFSVVSDTQITGVVPLLDGTLGPHKVIARNEVGKSELCCFHPYIVASSSTPVAFNSQRRFIKYAYKQINDRYGINSTINDTPSQTQGFEVMQIKTKAEHPHNVFEITCELSLQSDFWGAAVIALFKDDEQIPQKVWNYQLLGADMGQVARLTYLVDSVGDVVDHTWRIRVGKTHTSYPSIYMNRGPSSLFPYYGKTSSFMAISEIEKETAQHVI
tara:strand:- start:1191 stop:1991 length:801 start_codon:yes stop_codon:yes gene_type:complete